MMKPGRGTLLGMRCLAVVGLLVACRSSATTQSLDTRPSLDAAFTAETRSSDVSQDRVLESPADLPYDTPSAPEVDVAQDTSSDPPIDQRPDTASIFPVDALQERPFDLASDRSTFESLTIWPGGNEVTPAVAENAIGSNVSGLAYQPALPTSNAILWAVQNDPSKVYRLLASGTLFIPDSTEGWSKGKTLLYPDGTGSPDAEGVTCTEWVKPELYIVTERNNDQDTKSRMSILRYEVSGVATSLKATQEWNLTSQLPSADPNQGLEAIAWIPDTYLVAQGFFDENRTTLYDPAHYPNHGTGLFLVGMETTGMIYGFILNHLTNTLFRVSQFKSGQANLMDLHFDRDTESLWALCDDACESRMTLLGIDTEEDSATKGRFIVRRSFPAPPSLTKTNSEGLTLTPESECMDQRKRIFWADDDQSNQLAIRQGTVPCGRLF